MGTRSGSVLVVNRNHSLQWGHRETRSSDMIESTVGNLLVAVSSYFSLRNNQNAGTPNPKRLVLSARDPDKDVS
jgi:hypothetical protein